MVVLKRLETRSETEFVLAADAVYCVSVAEAEAVLEAAVPDELVAADFAVTVPSVVEVPAVDAVLLPDAEVVVVEEALSDFAA